MNNLRGISAIALALALSSCASIVEGTDQTIFVTLSPDTASCSVMRESSPIASVSKGNQSIHVSKSKNDLIFQCKAAGYADKTINVESSASGWGVVGCFLIDLCITDYSTGALNKYPEAVNISLEKSL